MNADLSSLPVAVLVGLALLVVAQVVLDVVALVDLYRRPAAQVITGNKWIWLAVILLVNVLGALLYLLVGRKATVPASDVAPSTARPAPTESIADALYGPRPGSVAPEQAAAQQGRPDLTRPTDPADPTDPSDPADPAGPR